MGNGLQLPNLVTEDKHFHKFKVKGCLKCNDEEIIGVNYGQALRDRYPWLTIDLFECLFRKTSSIQIEVGSRRLLLVHGYVTKVNTTAVRGHNYPNKYPLEIPGYHGLMMNTYRRLLDGWKMTCTIEWDLCEDSKPCYKMLTANGAHVYQDAAHGWGVSHHYIVRRFADGLIEQMIIYSAGGGILVAGDMGTLSEKVVRDHAPCVRAGVGVPIVRLKDFVGGIFGREIAILHNEFYDPHHVTRVVVVTEIDERSVFAQTLGG